MSADKKIDLAGKKLLDYLQNDLRSISNEAKKKMPQLKEAAESGIVRLRSASSRCSDLNKALIAESAEIMEPFFMGCDSKIPKIVQISLTAIQRLITFQAVSVCAAEHLINCLWNLMESGIEELKILQTVTLLISTNMVVQNDNLSKSIALCFRLHFTKNQTTNNTASATIRQLSSVIFDRVLIEDKVVEELRAVFEINYDELKIGSKTAPRSLRSCAGDAFLLLQDLIQLVNADQPFWLTGLTEMTRTFGLELLESIFRNYPEIFNKHDEFNFLLKERVCPLIIKLFSPNIKYKHLQLQQVQQDLYQQQFSSYLPTHQSNKNIDCAEKPFFPISMRLLRIVIVIISKYHSMLVTESEIFLSLLIKFLEKNKPNWQGAVALEAFYRLSMQDNLIKSFCLYYDMKPNSSKILRDITNALALYTQSFFIVHFQKTESYLSLLGYNSRSQNQSIGSQTSNSVPSTPVSSSGNNTYTMANNLQNPIQSPQPAFYLEGKWFPIAYQIQSGTHKSVYLEQLEKMDNPNVSDEYRLTTAYYCVSTIVQSILKIISEKTDSYDNKKIEIKSESMITKQNNSNSLSNGSLIQFQIKDSKINTLEKLNQVAKLDEDTFNLHQSLLKSTWAGFYAVLSLLLDTSTDEPVTEHILDLIEQLIAVYGIYKLPVAQEAMVKSLCKASLPDGYSLPVLKFKIPPTIEQANNLNIKSEKIQPSVPVPGSTINLTESSSNSDNKDDRRSYLKELSVNAYLIQLRVQPSITAASYLGINSNNNGSNTIANNNNHASQQSDLFYIKQQVVAVGTALPHKSQDKSSNNFVFENNPPNNGQQNFTSVILIAKNLQCMKVLLKTAHQHGLVLKENWYSVLLTLQHLVWILGLKPSTGGSLKSSPSSASDPSSSNNIITTAVMSDLPMLTTMLTRLFDSSQDLDDEGLVFMIKSLCQLSYESIHIAYENREPSLFAVAKLLESALVNLSRYHLFWDDMMRHLLWVCLHSQKKMREWGVEAFTTLIKAALQTVDTSSAKQNLKENQEQTVHVIDLEKHKKDIRIFLNSLQKLSVCSLPDIRQKQLDCCLHILQTSGDSMVEGWPQILDIVGSIVEIEDENLTRLSFQCLQLITSDFLIKIPSDCLVLVVNTTATFASQNLELNVSLTAIGLLWNIVDFFHQNKWKIKNDLTELDLSSVSLNIDENKVLAPFECLWMCFFAKLGDLCVDERLAVRKSASQTLFHTLDSHASILDLNIWSSILWKVLFPLLEKVHTISMNASNDQIMDVSKSMGIKGLGVSGNFGSFRLHHSRNTVQKQWSETQVLTLAGISNVFSKKRQILTRCLDDFSKAWNLLLKHIEIPAMSKNCEVSLNALNCFQEILQSNKITIDSNIDSFESTTEKSSKTDSLKQTKIKKETVKKLDEKILILWRNAWNTWHTIGIQCFKTDDTTQNQSEKNNTDEYVPSQAFLTSLVQIFQYLFEYIKYDFKVEDFKKLSSVLENAISVPIDLRTQVYLMSSGSTPTFDHSSSSILTNLDGQTNGQIMNSIQQVPLTALQEAIILIIELFKTEIINKVSKQNNRVENEEEKDTNLTNDEQLVTCLFSQLLTFSTYACQGSDGSQANYMQTSVMQNLNKSMIYSGNNLLAKYSGSNTQSDWIILKLVPFAEKCLEIATQLYVQCANWKCVIQSSILHTFIKTLRIPLSLKYNCPSQSTWQVAVQCLITILQIGLPVARQNPQDFNTIWADLALCLESYLFPTSNQQSMLMQELQQDELIDVKLVHIIRDNILPYAGEMPNVFVLQIVSILNRGSIHSATSTSPVDTESSRKLREEFAKTCFETLLQFSFLGPKGNPNLFIQCSSINNENGTGSSNNEIGLVNKLAVTSLLQRFKDVVKTFVKDEKLSGKCPLPRHRMAEISFVLKALATLINSLKKAPIDTVEVEVWKQLIGLYPYLLECTGSNSSQVNRSLREVLHEYKDLLFPYSYKKTKNRKQ